jgi:tetratricopeptide (TPR) repeat protein
MATADFQVRDFTHARDMAKQAIGLAPGDEAAVQLYGQAVSALGDYDGAIKVWLTYIAAHPTDGNATAMVAQLEEQKGDTQSAINYYWKALRLDPGQVLASNNLAYLLVESGESLDVALRLAQDARSGLPNSPSTADTLAWVYYARGRYLSARDLLEEAVKADPTNADAQYHLGMTYRKLGDKANAALHLKRATILAPNAQAGKAAAVALSQPA